MRTYLIAFSLSVVFGVLLTRMIRDLALRFRWVDSPEDDRKIHLQPIPRLGGIAIAIAFALPFIGLSLYTNDISLALRDDPNLMPALLGGGGIIFCVGVLDDFHGLPAIVKLLGQLAAASFVYWLGVRIEAVSIPFWQVVDLGWFSAVVMVFWFVLVMNSLNLIDGLDGLAAGVAILAGTTLFVMSMVEGNALAALTLACLVGATLGFYVYNVNPATIFLGDTGSLLLGFVLALVSVHSSQKSYALFSIVAAMLVMALPIFDLAMAVIRRWMVGKPLFGADQHHIHHLLLRKGLSQRSSVLLLYGATTLLSALGLLFIYANDAISALVIVALVPLCIIAVHFLGYGDLIRTDRRKSVIDDVIVAADARNQEVQALADRLSRAEAADAVWPLLIEAAETFGLESMTLKLPHSEVRMWSPERGDRTANVHLAGFEDLVFSLQIGDVDLGVWTTRRANDSTLVGAHDRALLRVVADASTRALVAIHFGIAPSLEPGRTTA